MKIVLLIGSSTSGKSTLCAELKEKHQWNILSFDEVAKRVRKPAFLELFKELSLLMTDNEIYQLCQNNILTISNGEHCIDAHKFTDTSLPDLEDILKKTGFDEYQTVLLSENMRSIVSSYVSYDQIMDELFINVFEQFDDESSVVLDVIPDRFGNANSLMQKFAKYCQKYRESHLDLNALTALVYCPPVTLSERIKKRNNDAIIKNTPHEVRKGLFPFQQFASLITVCNNQASAQAELGCFAKQELKEIVSTHSLIESKDVSPGSNEKVKSSEYQHLKKKFGFFKHQKQGNLSISEGLRFDITISTETESPSVLAEKLLSQVVSNAQSKYSLG